MSEQLLVGFPESVEALEDQLSCPPEDLIEKFASVDSDVVMLGVGGKMGPTMARMAHRCMQQSGNPHKVFAVSRFSDPEVQRRLNDWGLETISCDLFDPQQVKSLPDSRWVLNLAGFKFGAKTKPTMTWATNCIIPSIVCNRYQGSNILAFSTGNVYPMVSPEDGGSLATDPPVPDGEYPMAALGRERMYEYFSEALETPIVIIRLNYATELRYGVLQDIAQQVHDQQPVDVSMGYVNVIWLGDANAMTLRALFTCQSPARVLNMTGPDVLSVREMANQVGGMLDTPVSISGTEAATALLNNSHASYPLIGVPQMGVEKMLAWGSEWIRRGLPMYGKPTKFQVRDGVY